MKNISAKSALLFIQLLGLFLFPASNTAAAAPPEEVTIDQLAELYEPVIFDHLMHTEIYDCSRCHHDNENEGQNGSCSSCHSGRPIGAKKPCSTCHSADIYEQPEDSVSQQTPQYRTYHIDTPALKASWHLLCRNCHLEEDGPTDCQGCHAFTEKGREFFKEKK